MGNRDAPKAGYGIHELLMLSGHASEGTRESRISSWLWSLNIQNETQYTTDSGPADVHLMNMHCVIEVKRPANLKKGPMHAARGGESPYQQLKRYVMEERGVQRLDENRLQWRGAVTDGRKWWVWEWPTIGEGDEPKTYDGWDGITLDESNADRLTSVFRRSGAGKPWARHNMGALFENHHQTLKRMYDDVKEERWTKTQKTLWYRALEASGNAPPDGQIDELFVLHTLLITIARIIQKSLGNVEHTNDGFVGWTSKTIDGRKWISEVEDTINAYDWRRPHVDILRKMYEHYVDASHRKVYGEYYTPDWLADVTVRRVIDDPYIEQQLESYLTGGPVRRILDPCCGSGTFLYYAVKRVLSSEPLKSQGLSDMQKADFVAALVCGIDIHPVAVEMTKANVYRALRATPSKPLQIYQGDSLQTSRAANSMHENGDNFVIYTPRGNVLDLPLAYLKKSLDTVHRLVEVADMGKPFPTGLTNGLTNAETAQLKAAFDTLVDVCRDEGNSIWAWHIVNNIGPFMLSKDAAVGRIVSNPPWIPMKEIKSETRKSEIMEMAKHQKVWVGGKNATRFNTAALFVSRCNELYLKITVNDSGGTDRNSEMSACWIVSQAAIRGNNWKKFRERQKKLGVRRNVWDLGEIPFSVSESCAYLVNVSGAADMTLVRREDGGMVDDHVSWEKAGQSLLLRKTRAAERRDMPERRSAWAGEARQGATITPDCLVVVREESDAANGRVSFKTKTSTQGVWRGKSLEGELPASWIVDTVFQNNLLPYHIRGVTRTIIPPAMLGGAVGDAERERYWQRAGDQYEGNRGAGKNTPKTLERQLDFQGKLTSQLNRACESIVIYNAAGDYVCAARGDPSDMINSSLYAVPTSSVNESRFLASILNAECMENAYRRARTALRKIHTEFWKRIPIPRYDGMNEDHVKLAELAAELEVMAVDFEVSENKANTVQRREVRGYLRDTEQGRTAERLVAKIMSGYATSGGR